MPDGSVEKAAKPDLFESTKTIHPRAVKGRFRNIKTVTGWVLLAIFFILPLIRWDRGANAPGQGVLLDLTSPRFFVFWFELWPQEIYYLTGVLIVASLGLFLATSIGGRIWCGFACPHTVWTDLFVWIERKFEGDRAQRLRLEKAPWTIDKTLRKTGKHLAWLAVCGVTGFIFMAYFTDAPTLAVDMVTFNMSVTELSFFAIFFGMTYIQAGWTREQMCYYMCPWPRFQSAMLDEHSMVVTYHADRGENRAPKRKSQTWDERRDAGIGDCIDCGQCVQVCPVGIDVRTGAQSDCINCGLCVDACDNIMIAQGLPVGLITFDSLAAQDTRAEGKTYKMPLVRPRIIIYSLMILVVGGAMAWSYALRPRMDISVLRDRAPLFVTLSDGSIRNAYTFKVSNKTRESRNYALTAVGIEGADVKVIGDDQATNVDGAKHLSAEPDSVATYRVIVTAPRAVVNAASAPLDFVLVDEASNDSSTYSTVFMGPAR